MCAFLDVEAHHGHGQNQPPAEDDRHWHTLDSYRNTDAANASLKKNTIVLKK